MEKQIIREAALDLANISRLLEQVANRLTEDPDEDQSTRMKSASVMRQHFHQKPKVSHLPKNDITENKRHFHKSKLRQNPD